MRTALKDTPIAQNDPPSGMVQTTLNGATEWVKVEDMDRLTDYDLNLNTPQADAAAFDIF
jgi:penicillin-binding protein 1A